jgi:hypothetical protein
MNVPTPAKAVPDFSRMSDAAGSALDRDVGTFLAVIEAFRLRGTSRFERARRPVSVRCLFL